MQKFVLSKAEEKVMMFLWEQAKPLSVLEMLENWDDDGRTWTDNYMRAIIRSLEGKGAVEFFNLEQRGCKYARRFVTTFTKKEYFTQLAKRSGVSVSDMVKVEAVAMAENGDREGMNGLIHELEEIIEEYRAKDDEAK